MKTTKQNSRAALMALSLTILIGAGLTAAANAEAGVNFQVRVGTPAVQATLHSSGHGPDLHIQMKPACRAVALTEFDRKVARKLARRTAYDKQELLRLKRVGYSWAQIGNILKLPRSAVQNVLRQTSLQMARADRHENRSDRHGDRDRDRDRDRDDYGNGRGGRGTGR